MAGNFAQLFDKFIKISALKGSFGEQLLKHLGPTELHAADVSKAAYL
jgi:hypothetical protein